MPSTVAENKELVKQALEAFASGDYAVRTRELFRVLGYSS